MALAAAVIPAREAPARGEDLVPVLEPVASIPLGVIPSAFVATPTELWASAGIEGVIRVDPHSGRIRARIPTGGAVIATLADGGVWAVDVADDRLLEIDRRRNRVKRELRVERLADRGGGDERPAVGGRAGVRERHRRRRSLAHVARGAPLRSG